MDTKELTNFMSNLELIPCPEYDGIKWPSFPSFRAKGAENTVKEIMEFQSQDSDIMICTYAKSGTHWIYEITKMILKNSSELETNSKISTMLEAFMDLSELDAHPSPRVLNTHFQFQYLPRKHIQNRGKIVHMIRNPKDIMVSLYYHAQKDKFLDLNYPWNEFFDIWMSGNVPYGTWYDYELGMEKAEMDYPGMIYTCSYEDMKKLYSGIQFLLGEEADVTSENPQPQCPEAEISKLAKFIGVNCTNQMIHGIAKATSFDNMQKNKYDSTSRWNNGKGIIYRKGDIGDWKNHFSVSQNERFDGQYKEKMKNSCCRVTYD